MSQDDRSRSPSGTTGLTVAGMDCADCVAPIEDARPALPGTLPASSRWWHTPRMGLLAASALFLVLGYALEALHFRDLITRPLYGLAIALGGVYPARSAWASVRRRKVGINTLLTVATAGALAMNLWEEAALMVVVFSLGEVLEGYAVDKARGAMRALVALLPTEARVLRDGAEVPIPTRDVQVGEIVRIRPGERIPVDAEVLDGMSAVNQSAITGESIPVARQAGDAVFAGSVNGRGSLDVRVTKASGDTTIAQVIRLVEAAQRQKGRAQRFSARFGELYTPTMFVAALAVAIVPAFLFQQAFEPWFYRALVVLVVSCSCALVLSVPVAVVAGITTAARHGVLVKGGTFIEIAGTLRAVAFDKTGTLTEGRPQVTDVIPVGPASEQEVLGIAAALESRSEHPLADAIVAAAGTRGIELPDVTSFMSVTGEGVRGTFATDRATYHVRSPRFLRDAGRRKWRLMEDVARLQREGRTVVVVVRQVTDADDADVMGIIAVADRPRANAAQAIRRLRLAGIEHVVMLTGDNMETARAVARHVGADEVMAELLPEDKIAAVRALQARFGTVAMVGDGINDAPALAQATVGIAMGVAGTDVAFETADIALMSDNLDHVADVITISRRAVRNIRQNIAMSLTTIVLLVSAALLGWLPLTTGLVLNEGSALLIIGNGLRLLRVRGPEEDCVS